MSVLKCCSSQENIEQREDTARVHVAGFGKENAAPEEHCAVYGLRYE